MSRPSFRPRPLDIQQKLPIVRDPKEVSFDDANATRAVHHSHVALDKDNDQVQLIGNEKNASIPVPEDKTVDSYFTDVKPTFARNSSYYRFTGNNKLSKDYVEYDLDDSDDEWLQKYNTGQTRLPAEKFEAMLFKLEVACSYATEKRFQEEAAAAADRGVTLTLTERTALVASISNLQREQAFSALRLISTRQTVIQAVYEYWVDKRCRKGKPLLRRFQIPPPVSDTNPYNVFRPREKIHRPQTRRKRENDSTAYKKMAEVRKNIGSGLVLLDQIIKRERRKRDLINTEIELQSLQIKMKHEPRGAQDAHEAETLVTRPKPRERLLGATASTSTPKARDGASGPGPAAVQPSSERPPGMPTGIRKHKLNKKRRRDVRDPTRPPAPAYQPPPPLPELDMLFAHDLQMDDLSQFCIPSFVDRKRCRARVGRGGRIIFDRWDSLELLSGEIAEPLSNGDDGQTLKVENPAYGSEGVQSAPKEAQDVAMAEEKPVLDVPATEVN